MVRISTFCICRLVFLRGVGNANENTSYSSTALKVVGVYMQIVARSLGGYIKKGRKKRTGVVPLKVKPTVT